MRISSHIIASAALFLCTCACAFAQSARSILDQTANKLKNSGGIEASFEGTSFKGTQVAGEGAGTIYVQGGKFKISTNQLTTWFDGKTQWTLMNGSDEVNVSTPTAEELQSINPYTFVDLYKRGYDLTVENVNYKGTACHEVRLRAQKKNQGILLLILTIDKKTQLPVSVRMKSDKGEWTRIRVNGIHTNKKWNAATFQFNSKEHPGVEIIDLR